MRNKGKAIGLIIDEIVRKLAASTDSEPSEDERYNGDVGRDDEKRGHGRGS